MLTKEYRIALPLTVDEYRIAQLYMIAKKSREETKGAGSGVEILVNEPYTEGPGGDGQYTHKIFHVGSHMPGWFKALLPKSALVVEEKAWNAYPYTKTRYTCPFVEKFFLEIETKYLNDRGISENVFQLSNSDLRNRSVDFIDVVKDQLHGTDYKIEEDPRHYVSQKTGRGPLSDDWQTDSPATIMCAYKLCRVEFKYWGMQSKIEKFIHDVALRKTMLRAHRQAWAWQDEWHGLTMDDIRQLEKETQEALAKKMAADGSSNLSMADVGNESDSRQTQLTSDQTAKIMTSGDGDSARLSPAWSPASSPKPYKPRDLQLVGSSDDVRQRIWSRSSSRAGLHSPGCNSNKSFDLQLANWRLGSCVRHSDSSSDDEFFDCEEDVDGRSALTKWSSLEFINEDENMSPNTEELQFKPTATTPRDTLTDDPNRTRQVLQQQQQGEGAFQGPRSLPAMGSCSMDMSLPCSPTLSPAHQTAPCPTAVLILVLHAGSVLDSTADLAVKKADVSTFRASFDAVIRQHYPHMSGHVAIRLVSCPQICMDGLCVLSSLNPYSFDASASPSNLDGNPSASISGTVDFLPIGAIPLFAISSAEYAESVTKVISRANQAYQDFLKSDEGVGFNGQVVFVADSVGSILAYDALCRPNHYGRFGSEGSIIEVEPLSPGLHPKPNPLISISDGSSSGHEDGAFGISTLSDDPAAAAQQLSSVQHHAAAADLGNQLSAPPLRRRSSCSSEHSHAAKFDFEVGDFFAFGSPLGMVMAFRKMQAFDEKNTVPPRPVCSQMYNLFHPMDPMAARIEPLVAACFSSLQPVKVARYAKYPLGDGLPCHLLECIQSNSHLFIDALCVGGSATANLNIRRLSDTSVHSVLSGVVETVPLQTISALSQKWWGVKRLDYALYCPEGLNNFPLNALPHLFHASYWESSDVVAFILRQISRVDSGTNHGENDKEGTVFCPAQPREKWMKKRTSVKLKNVNANHRANDVIVRENVPQTLTARFMYGPLDMVALTGEKVDIHIMKDPPNGEWTFLSTEVTDKNGRLTYEIPGNKSMGYGMYPVKMVVRGDHTSVDFHLVVVPPKTESVVFSIDGSFTASVSVTGRDPKVRAGAVDVARHWQELGYLIIYVTGRPDMQQQKVVCWLSQHNFPHGLVSFVDGLCTDPLRHKAEYLRHLVHDADVVIHAAYGSSKDIAMYTSIGLRPEQIYIVGKASKKQHAQAQILSDGYAAHLSDLTAHGGSRSAQGNARMVLPRGCFGLPGQYTGLRRRRSAKRTTSYPMTGSSGSCSTGSSQVGATEMLGGAGTMKPTTPRGISPRPALHITIPRV